MLPPKGYSYDENPGYFHPKKITLLISFIEKPVNYPTRTLSSTLKSEIKIYRLKIYRLSRALN
jgi:hypothetical protein